MQSISRNVRLEYRTASGGFIDCLIPDAGVIVEQKGLGIDLDKPEECQGRMVTPFEQALTYAESFPRNRQPRFVVVCNFSTFRVHDRDACPRAELAGKYVEFTLEEPGRNRTYWISSPTPPTADPNARSRSRWRRAASSASCTPCSRRSISIRSPKRARRPSTSYACAWCSACSARMRSSSPKTRS